MQKRREKLSCVIGTGFKCTCSYAAGPVSLHLWIICISFDPKPGQSRWPTSRAVVDSRFFFFFLVVSFSCPLSLSASSKGISWFSLWSRKAFWVSFGCYFAVVFYLLIDLLIEWNTRQQFWWAWAEGCFKTANVILCWVILCEHVYEKWERFFGCYANGTRALMCKLNILEVSKVHPLLL